MQFVIPFVDSSDPHWQEVFQANGGELSRKDFVGGQDRYRDEGTLYLLLESIKTFAPWADVALVVAFESQVPDYVDRNKVEIITHDQFVPDGYRKVLFNSNAIESLIGRMPLQEQFVFLNDDIIFLENLTQGLFFKNDGRPKYTMSVLDPRFVSVGSYKSLQWRMNDAEINGIANRVVYSQHGPLPYRMSFCREFYREHEIELLKDIESLERTRKGHTQLSYAFAQLLSGFVTCSSLPGSVGPLKKKPSGRAFWCCLNAGCGIDMPEQLAKIHTYLQYRKMWG